MSCPDCFKGHIHEGMPVGKVSKIHGRNTYVASPPDGKSAKGIVVIIPDAFGWEFVNSRLLADHYATSGEFLVYLPDFMDNKPAPLWLLDVMPKLTGERSAGSFLRMPLYIAQVMYAFIPFLVQNRFGVVWPRVQYFFNALRDSSNMPVGAAGFCWGGKYALTLAHADNKTLVDAVFTGHPSGISVPSDVEKITKPTALAIGDKDMVLSMSQIDKIRGIWESNKDVVASEAVVYPGAGHGFCVRADDNNENQQQQSVDAEKQAVEWFSKHLRSSG